MPHSHLEQLWEADQALPNLKILNLLYSEKLRAVPDLSLCPNIEELLLYGCSNLEELPEVKEETMKNLKRLVLDGTAIKELPSSLDRLVGLEELSLQSCRKLKTIPSSIGNLSKLVMLNLSYCESLETFPEIPNYCLSSLTKLSLQGSGIVNLPESIAHLSSLTSLGLSDCKRLKCVPKLPPNLNQVSAFDCPSIKRMMLNSGYDSKEGTFEFHLTNSQELDATCLSNIEEEAYIKINDDAYWSVLFCYPGSAVPRWFPYSCKGNPVTIKNNSTNRLTGLALCVVLGRGCIRDGTRFKYRIGIISDRETHYSNHSTEDHTVLWKGKLFDSAIWRYGLRFLNEDHTVLWKHEHFHAQHFSFEFTPDESDNDCVYTVYVRTGSILKGGTDSKIGVKLYNKYGSYIYIKNLVAWGGLMGSGYNYFERSNLDIFSGRGPCLDGPVCAVNVTSDGDGAHHGWYCNYVEVTSTGPHVSCSQEQFTVEQWLATDTSPYQLWAVRNLCQYKLDSARPKIGPSVVNDGSGSDFSILNAHA
ncbi:hypothetical protein P8452_39515 [Trifolium repens]|nr:hypothetical protein P8452_39515 [Trifolium repens]